MEAGSGAHCASVKGPRRPPLIYDGGAAASRERLRAACICTRAALRPLLELLASGESLMPTQARPCFPVRVWLELRVRQGFAMVVQWRRQQWWVQSGGEGRREGRVFPPWRGVMLAWGLPRPSLYSILAHCVSAGDNSLEE